MGKKKDREKRVEAAVLAAIQEKSAAKVLNSPEMHETDPGVARATLDRAASGPSPLQRVAGSAIIDVILVLVVLVLSAVLLSETYHRAGYSKEIIALFGVVVGYLIAKTR